MQLLQMPTSQIFPNYKYTITLSGETYVFFFRYNTRMDRWVIDIRDASEQPILCGIPLVINRNLTNQYTALQVPLGGLYVLDETGLDAQPTLKSFVLDHTFYYADPSA